MSNNKKDQREQLELVISDKSQPKIFSMMEKFHLSVNLFAKSLWQKYAQKMPVVDKAKAQSNMEEFVELLVNRAPYSIRKQVSAPFAKETDLPQVYYEDEKPQVKSSEEILKEFGSLYVSREEIEKVDLEDLMDLSLEYDLKGLVPSVDENLFDFIYRANSTLFIHDLWKKSNLTASIDFKLGDEDLALSPKSHIRWAKDEDIAEAVDMIPYHMDLSWVAVSVHNKREFSVPALGLTYTIPQYNGVNWVQMLDSYKSREQYLSVLAHELVHAGTVHLDTKKDYLETKAYHVGRGSKMLGEQVVALNARPGIIEGLVRQVVQVYFPFITDKMFNYLHKGVSAVKIYEKTNSFKQVQKELVDIYGSKGNYILGRLTADELEEFRDTNNIPARIEMKDSLKWTIMKENFSRL